MRTLRPQELCALLDDRLHGVDGAVVAFDGDGTLWSGDVGDDFAHGLLEASSSDPEWALSPATREALRARLHAAGIHVEGGGAECEAVDGARVLRAALDGYRAGTFPERDMYEATAWLCAGWSTDRADAFARRSLVAHGIAQRAHPEVMAVVEWARSRHLPLYLVSASPGFVVRAAARLLGIGDFTILAMDPPVVGGHIGVGVVPPVTYGDGKVDALRGSVGAGVILAALGDNGFDVPMLQAARVGVAVRPKERLRSRAAEVPGLVVLSEG